MTLGKLATDSTDHIVTPAELAGTPLPLLLEVWHLHLSALVASAPGPAELLPDGWRRGHALDALALGEAVVESVRAGRWATAVDALEDGASVADVGTALGLDASKVVEEITFWAAGQCRYRLMDESRRDQVLTLLADRDQVQWEPAEVDAGIASWAAGQYRHELIDRERRNAILAVLADRDGGAR